jgi:hypothetical protein
VGVKWPPPFLPLLPGLDVAENRRGLFSAVLETASSFPRGNLREYKISPEGMLGIGFGAFFDIFDGESNVIKI